MPTILVINTKNANVFAEDASNAKKLLQAQGICEVKHIVCSLPLVLMQQEQQLSILDNFRTTASTRLRLHRYLFYSLPNIKKRFWTNIIKGATWIYYEKYSSSIRLSDKESIDNMKKIILISALLFCSNGWSLSEYRPYDLAREDIKHILRG